MGTDDPVPDPTTQPTIPVPAVAPGGAGAPSPAAGGHGPPERTVAATVRLPLADPLPTATPRPESPDAPTLCTPAAGPADAGGPPALGRVFGKYDILEELGRGGMGIVYKARQRDLGRWVALKVLLTGEVARPEEVARFRREAAASAALRHPGIVAVHEVGAHAGQEFFTMDYIEGRNLAGYAAAVRPSARAALALVRKVADALHHAHGHGIIHRDVKPANILVDARGEPYLTDFGLAKLVRGGPALTASGTAIGTPAYMAPEQARGATALIDGQSDVYSLGAVLYELLAGRPPFTGASAVETMMQVATAEPPPPRSVNPAVPPEAEAICLKAMERDRARRYLSAAELAQDIGRYLRGEPTRARPPSAWGRLARVLVRRRLALGVTAGMAVAGVMTTGLVLERSEAGARARASAADAERLRRAAEGRQQALAAAEPLFRKAEEAYARADRLLYVQGEVAARDLLAARAEAVRWATAALELDDDHVEARLLRGRVRAEETKYADAIADFTRIIRAHPDLPTPWRERARATLDQCTELRGTPRSQTGLHGVRFAGLPPEPADCARLRAAALRDLETLRAGHPDLAGDRELSVLLAMGRGDYAQVLETLRDVRYGDLVELRLVVQRGLANLYAGRFEDADADLGAALQFQVNRAELWATRALARRARGDLAGARADADRACALDPASAHYLNDRGLVKRQLGDVEGAVQDYDRALELEPGSVSSLVNRAIANAQLQRHEAALRDFDRAIELDPGFAMAWGGRGGVYRALGGKANLERALHDLTRCIECAPDLALGYNNRGLIHAELGDPGRALADYRKALELDPGYADALNNVGAVHRERGQQEEALAWFERASAADPDNLPALVNRGGLYDGLGRYADACAVYDRALRLRPDLFDLYAARGSVRVKRGDAAGALADFQHYLERAPADASYRRQVEEWARQVRAAGGAGGGGDK